MLYQILLACCCSFCITTAWADDPPLKKIIGEKVGKYDELMKQVYLSDKDVKQVKENNPNNPAAHPEGNGTDLKVHLNGRGMTQDDFYKLGPLERRKLWDAAKKEVFKKGRELDIEKDKAVERFKGTYNNYKNLYNFSNEISDEELGEWMNEALMGGDKNFVKSKIESKLKKEGVDITGANYQIVKGLDSNFRPPVDAFNKLEKAKRNLATLDEWCTGGKCE